MSDCTCDHGASGYICASCRNFLRAINTPETIQVVQSAFNEIYQLRARAQKLESTITRLKEALEKTLKYCDGPKSCKCFEHDVSRKALAELEREDGGAG